MEENKTAIFIYIIMNYYHKHKIYENIYFTLNFRYGNNL